MTAMISQGSKNYLAVILSNQHLKHNSAAHDFVLNWQEFLSSWIWECKEEMNRGTSGLTSLPLLSLLQPNSESIWETVSQANAENMRLLLLPVPSSFSLSIHPLTNFLILVTLPHGCPHKFNQFQDWGPLALSSPRKTSCTIEMGRDYSFKIIYWVATRCQVLLQAKLGLQQWTNQTKHQAVLEFRL